MPQKAETGRKCSDELSVWFHLSLAQGTFAEGLCSHRNVYGNIKVDVGWLDREGALGKWSALKSGHLEKKVYKAKA